MSAPTDLSTITNKTWACPKCKHVSGDDWSQCCGKCPIEQSPHYDKETAEKYGNPVPYLTPSGDEE